MAEVKIDIPKLYQALCPKCKEKLEEMIKDEITSAMIKKSLEGKTE